MDFKLNESFVEQYKDRIVEWGPLGEFVYVRTYSRTKEDGTQERWYETVRRVVEGSFSFQKKHCENLRLHWNNAKAQKSAHIMYDKIFNFKFLPPGRSLWCMGTEFVKEKGGAALNNCGMISTEDIDVRGAFPFSWTMDALMLGVGVGFDTKGAGKVKIKEPKQDGVFVIPDSREGWVESVYLLISAFFQGRGLPTFDYSLIREAGLPIKGFGGISSGPEPLRKLHENLVNLLRKRIGEKITSVDIVDIVNMISACVISGNIRRSACIAIGDHEDVEYVQMKDYTLHKEELMSHRWASNNSVFAEVGKTNYRSFVESIKLNGEPGIVWLDNMKKYSRLIDPPDYKDSLAVGTNPCFTGDTLIAVADGRGAVSLKQLAEERLDVPVYSVNTEGKVEIRMGRNPRITGHNKEIVKITLDDETTIKTTPNHIFYLNGNERKEAKDLKEGDSLVRLTKYIAKTSPTSKDYIQIYTKPGSKEEKVFEHRLIAEFNKKEEWDALYSNSKKNGWARGGLVIHHKDYCGVNNKPDNLEIMTFKDHCEFHGRMDNSGEKNGMFGKKHTEKTRGLIAQKTRERMLDEEYRNNISLKNKEFYAKNPEAKENLKKVRSEEYKKWCESFLASTDLETFFVDGALFVKKECEACGSFFVVPAGKREISFCSRSCSNTKPESIEKRRTGQTKFFENRQQEVLHKQIMVFKDLGSPSKKEWVAECKKRGVPYRIRNDNVKNDFCLKSYEDLKERASVYNHRIKAVEFLTETETVYNITVDENHNFFVTADFKGIDKNMSGVLVANCGEQTLENGELCCLCETFPSKHETYEEFKETLKYAYLYAKSVTLVGTHWPETNAVLLKNRRIGLSQSGIIDAFAKHGRRNILHWCDSGYKYVEALDKVYSDWLCIPRSKKMTAIKPSGSVALLPGVSAGIHYPHSKFYIRRVRLASNSPLVPIMKEAGYPIEEEQYGDIEERKKTSVVVFPVCEKYFSKKKDDVSIWEQVKNVVDYQKYWSDNNVSVTVTFKKEEAEDIPFVLEAYEDNLKSISFLPLSEHGYAQAPYETITEEQYNEMKAKIKYISIEKKLLEKNASIETKAEKFCTNDTCTI